MRIIGGIHRSRTILGPPAGSITRPMPDRVRQALFDRLTVAELLGGWVLDLFCGTGSLGLESLSRDADHCIFIERDRIPREALKKNVAALQAQEKATVLGSDALSADLAITPRLRAAEAQLRVIFCDPPYPMIEDDRDRKRIIHLGSRLFALTEPGGLLMLRTPAGIEAPRIEAWNEAQTFIYGTTALHFYRKPEPQEDSPSDADSGTGAPD